MDHECFSALQAAIKEQVQSKLEKEALKGEKEGHLERQFSEFIALVRSVTKRNKFVQQCHKILAGEEELMQGGFQFHYGDFCRRCVQGIGVLECDRCHDSICF